MNEVGNHYNMQQLMDLVAQQSQNVNALVGTIVGIGKEVEGIKDDVTTIKGEVEQLKYSEEITYEQQNTIDSAISKTVYNLLGVGVNPEKWTVEERTISAKYGRLFRKRLRLEVSNKGHLAYPYRTTKKGNYVSAINDIEAWIPRNGIAGLMKEADDNALARKIAKEQGY